LEVVDRHILDGHIAFHQTGDELFIQVLLAQIDVFQRILAPGTIRPGSPAESAAQAPVTNRVEHSSVKKIGTVLLLMVFLLI
jgi:hypothetical protein